ncbi:hypothetical protein [Lysobacter gummosus]
MRPGSPGLQYVASRTCCRSVLDQRLTSRQGQDGKSGRAQAHQCHRPGQ